MTQLSRLLPGAALVALPTLAVAQSALPLKRVPTPTQAAITAGDLMTRLYIYADDSLQGRETGTPGHLKATNYIAGQLAAMGLEPMGENGTYFQTVPVIRRSLDASSAITADGLTLKPGVDFVATSRGVTKAIPQAPVVYGGVFGDTANPLTAEQAAGKIVLLRAPANGNRGFAFGGRGRAGAGFRAAPASAAGIITVAEELSPALIRSAMQPRDGDVQLVPDPTAAPTDPQITITRAAAEQLLGGSLDAAQKGQSGKTVRVSLKFNDTPAPARNVIAAYRGHDPKLKQQWVALGAHNDHIGIRQQGPVTDSDSMHAVNRARYAILAHIPRGQRPTADQQAQLDAIHVNMDSIRKAHPVARADSISNGADDDGSGTVTLLEVAEKFAKTKPNTKRSVLFVWHVGEEKGLWGSAFVTDHPPVPRDSIVAQLNMDMVGRGAAGDLPEGNPNYVQLVGSRRLSTELGDLVETLNKKQAKPFVFDYQFDANGHPENIYCRSDHANYARYGIPVVFFTTGLHGDYHQVTDEPQYIDYAHMARIGNFVYTMADYVADMDHRPVVDHAKPTDPHARCVQ